MQLLVLTVAGWVNRHQDDLIDYLREENRVLREQLGSRPPRLTDAQRRRLAVRGHKLGRRVLTQVAGIVTPDTILRWYRKLIAKKYDGSACRGRGRPALRRHDDGEGVRSARGEAAKEIGGAVQRRRTECEQVIRIDPSSSSNSSGTVSSHNSSSHWCPCRKPRDHCAMGASSSKLASTSSRN